MSVDHVGEGDFFSFPGVREYSVGREPVLGELIPGDIAVAFERQQAHCVQDIFWLMASVTFTLSRNSNRLWMKVLCHRKSSLKLAKQVSLAPKAYVLTPLSQPGSFFMILQFLFIANGQLLCNTSVEST
jgi:hypothetical protein